MNTLIDRAAGKLKHFCLTTPPGLALFKLIRLHDPRFTCPVCNYHGPFNDLRPESGFRRHAICPKCSAKERHRLQYLVLEKLAVESDFSKMSILHFAPEPFFERYFRGRFGSYISADLAMRGVDYHLNLLQLPFKDRSFDVIFASHVLEHVQNDHQALREIRRVLKDSGIGVLPVPLVAETTVEYPEANPHESYHVRAPGPDYFDRYQEYFSRIETFGSADFPADYQLYIYEDRSNPPPTMPHRPGMPGDKHADIIPVCYR